MRRHNDNVASGLLPGHNAESRHVITLLRAGCVYWPVNQIARTSCETGVSMRCIVERIPVSSSNLAYVGYDTESLTLEIGFRNGSVYQYFQVPIDLYRGLLSAASHGSYFDAHIKKGGFPYKRVK